MARKIFYTEHDIQDMHKRGVTSIDVNDDVVMTDLAREQAIKLGIKLNKSQGAAASVSAPPPTTQTQTLDSQDELIRRVKAAVMARLGGSGVDSRSLDAAIQKVIAGMK